MRELRSSLAAVAVLLLLGCAGPTPPSQELGMPTAASIEGLVREKLAKNDFENPLQNPFKKPVLLNFGLVELDQVSPTQWHAEIELSLDFGPGREASAVLKRDDGREYVEYAWGTEAFPPNFTYDDFELVVERTARATGHTRRILELVQ